MKRLVHTLKTATLGLALSGAFAAAAQADTLREIYELALQNDAQLKAAEASYRANLELERLGLAALLPQVQGNYQYTDNRTETVANAVNVTDNGLDIFENTTIVDTEDTGYQVSLDQAIFNMPAWFSFKSGKQRSKEAEATFAADQQDLIVRVVESYLGVLRAQDNLEASQARERAFQRQLEQTQQRFEVGLIAITDVHEAQAAYDLARVERITDENNLNVAIERLSVLTGRYHSNLHLLSDDFEIKSPEPADRAAWVDFALDHNFRLSAASYLEEAARQNARAFASEHLPTVSGRISYSDTETRGTRTEDPPSLFLISPDADRELEVYQVRVDVPLFSGGRISAQRRQAAQEYIAARENRINLMRNTVTDTRSLHMTVINDVARVNARRLSIVSSQSALDATTAGYEVGTRNVVDVLNAQNTLFQARRDYANARYDYVNNLLRLKLQAGLLSPEDVYRLEAQLVAPPAPTASSTGKSDRSPYPTRR
ncbi:MAG: TolC family outer membrane protein [Halieaceae bacterium]|jgi:outer membrane protein|nr:TolC family outer membrane protein [Halieaceae bacterium]